MNNISWPAPSNPASVETTPWSERLFARSVDFFSALGGAALGTALAGLVYFVVLEHRDVNDALFLRELVPRPIEYKLIALALIGKTVAVAVAPCLLFAVFAWRGRRAWAAGVYLVSLWLSFFFLIVDLRVYLLHGRHLLQILAFAALPEGREAGGNVAVWIGRFATWGASAAALALIGLSLSVLAASCFTRLSRRALRALVAVPLLGVMLLLGPMAVTPGAGWQTAGLHARLLGVLPFTFGAERMMLTRTPSDPVQAELQQALAHVYQDKFTYLFRKRQRREHAHHALATKPNIFLILVESLRADVFTADLMPNLHAWAEQGLRRSRHFAGTNYSESGTFTILYGQSPLVYHTVLDSRVPPPLCEGLRALSYKCAYYTGHPTVWWRREEFLGPDTFDIHERVQKGTWNDWDREALSKLGNLVTTSGDGGYLGITFLMSTHYEYRYPPEFARFLPADEPEVAWDGRAAKDFHSLGNRYKNAVGFVDQLIGETLRKIDTSRDYVIVTGDHAEGLGENGRVGHGFDFSDTLLHVPFAMRGPGIQPEELGGLSLHADIWPTVRSLATGGEPAPNDLRRPGQRQGALFAHCEFNQPEADALLLEGDLRVRMTLSLQTPEVSVKGFEDAQGRPVAVPSLDHERIAALASAFERYVDDAARDVDVVR